MRATIWLNMIGCMLLLGGCDGGGGGDSPPAAGGGPASADSFTDAVVQHAASGDEDQEPSDQLAELAETTPENTEPANL